jgi:arsenite-transporting ATPase
MIEKPMSQYLAENSRLKYIFFGGKGGVGKTVLAGTTALWFAGQGKKTLLASTNPIHSLSSLLGMDVFGKATPVAGVPNLDAYEIDTHDTIEKSKKEIREKIQWFLQYADLKTKADEFVESATMNPSFEESAMFENMIDLMFENKYDTYVFDTAPTANARRLLGMSGVYSLWVNKMVKSREEAISLKDLLSYSKKKEKKDPLMEYLLNLRHRMGNAKELLTDDQLTSFFFITLPEALPIAVITRFINWFREFGIPVGGVVVNMVIDKSSLRPDSPDFVKNRVAMQDDYMAQIEQLFDGSVRSILPLFETEVRGVEMLKRVSSLLFSPTGMREITRNPG